MSVYASTYDRSLETKNESQENSFDYSETCVQRAPLVNIDFKPNFLYFGVAERYPGDLLDDPTDQTNDGDRQFQTGLFLVHEFLS